MGGGWGGALRGGGGGGAGGGGGWRGGGGRGGGAGGGGGGGGWWGGGAAAATTGMLPDWLDLAPAGGLLPAGASVTLVAEAALPEDVFYSDANPRRAHCLVVGRAAGGGGEWSGWPLEIMLD